MEDKIYTSESRGCPSPPPPSFLSSVVSLRTAHTIGNSYYCSIKPTREHEHIDGRPERNALVLTNDVHRVCITQTLATCTYLANRPLNLDATQPPPPAPRGPSRGKHQDYYYAVAIHRGGIQ